ncbi:MAG: hypothetical protein FWC36_07190 [Spirochaetes bacterium]|nr:hypothetical protein [Spirochaetota bacterium]
MKKTFFMALAVLFVIAFFYTPLLAAQTNCANCCFCAARTRRNYQRIIPLSSPLYREMDRLYLLARKSRPSLARPWSADEAKKIFEALPENFLDSVPASVAIIKREIGFGNENTGAQKMSFRISPEINIAAHVKTNNERKEWEHGYEDRAPLLHMPLEWWFFRNFYMNMEITFKQDYLVVNSANTSFFNINPLEFDWYFPFRAFMSIGGERWNLQLGRDQVSWGAGVTGNIQISDYSDFFNIIRFTTYWRRFKFTAIYMGLEAWLTPAEKEFRNTYPDRWAGRESWDFNEGFKALAGHRVEFRILDNLSFAISETSMFGNRYINITELNPMMIYHNLFTAEYSNVMLGLELDFTPFRGFNIYLQLAMDEVLTAEDGFNNRPRAWGYLAGITYIRPAAEGFLTFNLEAAVVEPYMYNRWHPNTRFTNRRRIWSYSLDTHYFLNKPIGYRHGPDSVILYAAAKYEKPGRFLAGISARYALMGGMNNSLDYAGTYDTGPGADAVGLLSGIVERSLVVGLHGRKQITERISVTSDIYYVHIRNYQRPSERHNLPATMPPRTSGTNITDLEFTASVRFRF